MGGNITDMSVPRVEGILAISRFPFYFLNFICKNPRKYLLDTYCGLSSRALGDFDLAEKGLIQFHAQKCELTWHFFSNWKVLSGHPTFV